MARSKDNLELLLLLGYSPGWLSSRVAQQFVPVYVMVVLIALVITQLIQWAFHHYVMFDRPELSPLLHWSVAVVAVFLVILSIIANHTMVKRLLTRLY